MWLYPVPSVLAFAGWTFMYLYADHNAPGRHPIEWSLAWVAAGTAAFALWAGRERVWPFGDRQIREQYLAAQDDEQNDGQNGAQNDGQDGGQDDRTDPVTA